MLSTVQDIRRLGIVAGLVWSAMLALSLWWNEWQAEQEVLHLARQAAVTNIAKDLTFRRWAATHGGVYVPISEETPPNRYLDVPNRDVTTSAGQRLTLMNPAYIMRQVMTQYAQQYGVYGHLTSLQLKNPDNRPDEWETETLQSFTYGTRERVAVVTRGQADYLRLMQSVPMERPCLKCHEDTGVPEGGVRGGISTMIPLEPLRAAQLPVLRGVRASHFGLWLAGLLGLVVMVRGTQHRAELLQATAGELSEVNRRLDHLAHHDPLTELPNRTAFRNSLEQSLVAARGAMHLLALVYVDLDRFKNVNDSLGHEAGDELLRQVSRRMFDCLQPGDLAARLGGDEFALVLHDPGDVADISLTAQRLIRAFEVPFHVDGHELFIGASLGIAVFPQDGASVDELLRNADVAMYQAKQRGRGSYMFYAEEFNAQTRVHLMLESSLRHAIEREELHVVYQPQIELATGRILGVEALARWRHPELGEVMPGAFIPLAEETGLIVPIGEWVLGQATRDFARWRADGIAPEVVAVNLSARQFRAPDVLMRLQRIVADSGLERNFIELEVTESVIMHDPEEVVAILNGLDILGFQISIDDFGTGYSSLSYLRRFPVDKLKIDRSFISEIPGDAHSEVIARSIIDLGHNMGLPVIAEGVETAAQVEFLRRHGCELVQGYFYAHPLRIAEIEEQLRRQAGR